mgnify:FL=1
MDEKQMKEKLIFLSEKIKNDKQLSDFVIIGIKRRGAVLADRIKKLIGKENLDVGYLDISLYRDDLSKIGPNPIISQTDILFSIDDRKVLLVDDVLYTGRTVRAALDAIFDFGRPSLIKLLVFIDRGHKELPICADYVGEEVKTKKSDIVEVKVKEIDGVDEVVIVERKWSGKEKIW